LCTATSRAVTTSLGKPGLRRGRREKLLPV
jgi:hypothetical protein